MALYQVQGMTIVSLFLQTKAYVTKYNIALKYVKDKNLKGYPGNVKIKRCSLPTELEVERPLQTEYSDKHLSSR